MKVSPVMGHVNPDTVRVLTLTVENEEDVGLLDRLLTLFRNPNRLTEVQRLAWAVLAASDGTVPAALIDEAQEYLRAVDANKSYVSRRVLLDAIDLIRKRLDNYPIGHSAADSSPVHHEVLGAVFNAINLMYRAEPKRVEV